MDKANEALKTNNMKLKGMVTKARLQFYYTSSYPTCKIQFLLKPTLLSIQKVNTAPGQTYFCPVIKKHNYSNEKFPRTVKCAPYNRIIITAVI